MHCLKILKLIPKRHRIWALIIIIVAVVILALTTKADTAIITGIRFQPGEKYGMLGCYKSLSPRMALCTYGALGGDQSAWSTDYMLHLPLTRNLTLSGILGPTVEITETDPDTDQTVAYLLSSCGAYLTYTRDPVSVWAAAKYTLPDDKIKRWTYALGIAIFL